MKQTQMENVKSQVRGGDDEINLMYTKYIYIYIHTIYTEIQRI